jgi:hypothetical protein
MLCRAYIFWGSSETLSLLRTQSMLAIVVILNCVNSGERVVGRGHDGWAADAVRSPRAGGFCVSVAWICVRIGSSKVLLISAKQAFRHRALTER